MHSALCPIQAAGHDRVGVRGSVSAASWTFQPVTPERWADFEQLFGPHGASAGCWCMFERLTRAEFAREQGAGNKQTMRAIIAGGAVPGLLAYAGTAPVGWCSIGPRKVYGALERSRRLQRVDDQPVWSVVCVFTARSARRQGLTVALLRAAVAYAREHGARIVEGYPVEPSGPDTPDAFAWRGTASAFRQAGFVEVLRRSPTHPIMRYVLAEP